MSLLGLYREALGRVDGLRGFELVSTLSRLHRVQGSRDLEVAVEHVAMALQELGLEARVEVLRGPLGLWEHYGFWEPRGWSLVSALVEVMRSDGSWEAVASTAETPLVAMVHSPPGSVEARAVYARPHGSGGGGVAVTGEPGWEGYYVLTMEQGYEAVVGFHAGPGVRYWGIYPPPFSEPPSAPAASLPAERALRLVGERVRVTVEAEYSTPTTPVLVAEAGEGPVSVVLVAHVCHPRPGAHDNASGVAAVVEALAALAGSEERLREAGLRVVAVLAPEWTGVAAALRQGLVDASGAVAGVSVDMVAANTGLTGGLLRLAASPAPAASLLDPVLDAVLAAVEPLYGGPRGYEWGSDHDVLLGHSVPASMLNEWPDQYYHTSLDTPDHIEPDRIARIAASIAAAVLYTAENPAAAAEAGKALHRGLLARRVLENPGAAEAAHGLHRIAAGRLEAAAEAIRRGEPPQRPPPVVERRPPYSRTYIYMVLRGRELLLDKRLREAARVLATIAAATGSWEEARLYHAVVHGRWPSAREEEAARRLASAENRG